MMPGASVLPSAFTVRAAGSLILPTATIRSSATATLPLRGGLPRPSMMLAFLMSRSSINSGTEPYLPPAPGDLVDMLHVIGHIAIRLAEDEDAHQVTPALGLGPVLVFAAAVHDDVVVEVLDVALLEHHVDAELVALRERLHVLHRFHLLGRQPGNLRKTLRAFDVLAAHAAEEPAIVAAVHRLQVVGRHALRLL